MYGVSNEDLSNEQIVTDIQSLQQIEQQLFSSLESNPNLSTAQQQQIINKMRQIANMRMSLYKTLSDVNHYYEGALESSIGTLQEQVAATDIVEDELNRVENRRLDLEEEKNNMLRLAEINNYYGDKYEEHTQLMKIIIFTLIPIIAFSYLNIKGILPNTIYYILLIIVISVGAYYFLTRFGSIIMRNNMNYQTYDWYFNANAAPKGPITTTDPWDRGISGVDLSTCIGSACCSTGMVYNDAQDKCVRQTEGYGTMGDSIVQTVLTKHAPYKNHKIDYNLKQPEPFNI
ncbi:MAG: hypothetical protein ACOVRN_00645 [Flavobacterium sp.]